METDDRDRPQPVSAEDRRTARRFVVASSVASGDVDDVTQEVLCGLAFRRDPLEVPEGLAPAQVRAAFLWRVVERLVAHHRRRQARYQAGARLWADVLPQDPVPSAEEQVLAFEPFGTLHRALAELKDREPALHAVLVLVAEGIPIGRVAALLEIPQGTAWDRLRRARDAMCALFRRLENAETQRATRPGASTRVARGADGPPRPRARATSAGE